MQNDPTFQRGWRPLAPEPLIPPESGAELLAWQDELETAFEASLEQAFTASLLSICSLALSRSLTQAAASQKWADAVDKALTAQRLPLDDPAVGRLRDELLALSLGDQAYSSAMAVDTLYRQQLARPADDEYVEALHTALDLRWGTTTSTGTILAAGAILPAPAGVLTRLKERVSSALDWMKPAKVEGLSWKAQIRRGVRSGFTGLTGSLVIARLSATGARSKKWVTKEDTAVRGTHAAAHGQVVPLNAPFVVGGQMLMYPGDPRAAIGERVNCRCVLTSGDE